MNRKETARAMLDTNRREREAALARVDRVRDLYDTLDKLRDLRVAMELAPDDNENVLKLACKVLGPGTVALLDEAAQDLVSEFRLALNGQHPMSFSIEEAVQHWMEEWNISEGIT